MVLLVSPLDLAPARSVVFVFASPECPACEEYKPRFEAEVDRWAGNGAPVAFVADGDVVAPGSIAVVLVDVTSEHETVQGLADSFGVHGLPTTIVMTRHGAPIRMEGALEDREIYDLLKAAAQ